MKSLAILLYSMTHGKEPNLDKLVVANYLEPDFAILLKSMLNPGDHAYTMEAVLDHPWLLREDIGN